MFHSTSCREFCRSSPQPSEARLRKLQTRSPECRCAANGARLPLCPANHHPQFRCNSKWSQSTLSSRCPGLKTIRSRWSSRGHPPLSDSPHALSACSERTWVNVSWPTCYDSFNADRTNRCLTYCGARPIESSHRGASRSDEAPGSPAQESFRFGDRNQSRSCAGDHEEETHF